MAGTKGMKGGGGARPGAGRMPHVVLNRSRALQTNDPLAFLVAVARNSAIDMRLRVSAAIALLPYVHRKIGVAGKKEMQLEDAGAVSEGRFKPTKPPKLRLVPKDRGQRHD